MAWEGRTHEAGESPRKQKNHTSSRLTIRVGHSISKTGPTAGPRGPQSKGLDPRVSEPEDLELLGQPDEGGTGCRGQRGYLNRTSLLGTVKATFPTTQLITDGRRGGSSSMPLTPQNFPSASYWISNPCFSASIVWSAYGPPDLVMMMRMIMMLNNFLLWACSVL